MQVVACVDSGAARIVCPIEYCDHEPVTASRASAEGEHFKTASGVRLPNQGDRLVHGMDDVGRALTLKYAVADVTDALDSVSQICDAGNTVVFTSQGGYVVGPAGKIEFQRDGDTYIRKMWVKRPRRARKGTAAPMDPDGEVEMTDGEKKTNASKKDPFGRPGSPDP